MSFIQWYASISHSPNYSPENPKILVFSYWNSGSRSRSRCTGRERVLNGRTRSKKTLSTDECVFVPFVSTWGFKYFRRRFAQGPVSITTRRALINGTLSFSIV
jgi:hypothetical protein